MATLAEIDAKLDILLARAGSNVVTVTVKDDTGATLVGVGITIRSPYDDLVGVAITGAGGLATVLLDSGSWLFYLRQGGTGIAFANPYTVTVSDDTLVELTATAPALASPGDPSLARVYGWVQDLGLTSQAGIRVTFTLRESNVVTDGGIVLSDGVTVETDSTGKFEIELPVAASLVPSTAKYVVEIEEAFDHAGWRQTFPADCLVAGSSYVLGDICR